MRGRASEFVPLMNLKLKLNQFKITLQSNLTRSRAPACISARENYRDARELRSTAPACVSARENAVERGTRGRDFDYHVNR